MGVGRSWRSCLALALILAACVCGDGSSIVEKECEITPSVDNCNDSDLDGDVEYEDVLRLVIVDKNNEPLEGYGLAGKFSSAPYTTEQEIRVFVGGVMIYENTLLDPEEEADIIAPPPPGILKGRITVEMTNMDSGGNTWNSNVLHGLVDVGINCGGLNSMLTDSGCKCNTGFKDAPGGCEPLPPEKGAGYPLALENGFCGLSPC